MNGLEIVIKNQKGRIEPWGDDLSFICPICEERRYVLIKCGSTMKALANIDENPIIQLICMSCNQDIYIVQNHFNSGYFRKSEKYYENLGWLSKNYIKKIIRHIKSWKKRGRH